MGKFECRRCGLACKLTLGNIGGHLLGIYLEPEEIDRFPKEVVFPLFGHGDPIQITAYQLGVQPCPHYEERGGLGLCKIYEKRPKTCAAWPVVSHFKVAPGCTAIQALSQYDGVDSDSLVNEIRAHESKLERMVGQEPVEWVWPLDKKQWVKLATPLKPERPNMLPDIVPVKSMMATSKPTPIVSIVIPTYNHLDLLKACVESIIKYTDLTTCEVIIVANGCTDGTIDWLKNLPVPFRYVVDEKPLGYTAATNLGIKAAIGEYVLLLNNDTVILEQPKNSWIDQLLAPFKNGSKVGVTGPVKFHWNCGDIKRTAIAFWCAMIPKKLFQDIGLLDEIFSPGMGEDGDFCIKTELSGYSLVQVPTDTSEEFGKGIPNQVFPIYHKGSGTFGDKDYSEISKRNAQILRDRYSNDELEAVYHEILRHPCDVDRLFPTLRKYASECKHLTEFGVRGVVTTWAFLASRPKRLVSYDIEYAPYADNIAGAKKQATKAGISFEFRHQDVLAADIEQTDMLFIDTKHTYQQLVSELRRHSHKVNKYILIHDTESFGLKGEDGTIPGEKQAIVDFCAEHPEWVLKEHIEYSNGLTILERKMVQTSIIIPTCGKNWQNVLKTCLEAALAFTDLSNKEIIVVPNGAPKEAIDYLRTKPVRTIEFAERVGYIRAVNAGIKEANSEYVVLLDDDSFLLGQPTDQWLQIMREPFSDPKMGATGPFGQTYEDLGQVLHSGCTMYKKPVLTQLNNFDEAFNPGYMGDEDLAIRIRKAGYKLEQVPKDQPAEYVDGIFQLKFPVVHMGNVNTMDKAGKDLPLVKKNRDLLYARHKSPLLESGYKEFPMVGAVEPKPKVSIIIPTYKNNFFTDEKTGEKWNILKKNLQTLAEYTDLSQVEIIVVCNGCVDGQAEYVNSLGAPFRAINFPEALGYTKATNEGIKAAKGEFLIFYNDDVVLLPQPKNMWLDWLLEPFQNNPKMGVTGPLQLHDDYADQDVIIGFCLCVKRSVLNEAMASTRGLLDEIFSPGGGEDIDLCCKVRAKGYTVRQVPREGKLGFSHTNTGEYPIWHINNQTFKDIEAYTRWYVKRNGFINMKRYNKNIKLNLGSGGIEYKGYLSVDLYDRRATIIMDATKLDFDENSVTEILALHLVEHLSPYKVLDVFKHWHKILKPGGKLVMELPDIEQLCKRFVTANTGERYGILNAVYGSVNTTGEGEPSDITSPHLFGWWPQSIADHLWNAGFTDIKFGPEQFPHPESNMHVEATKSL